MPQLSKDIRRPQRWDVPFWREKPAWESSDQMTEADVDRIVALPPFSKIDPSRFPPSMPYRGVLLNDTCLRRVKSGEIIVRQGDYGSSAFFIISGAVRVMLDPLDPSLLGRLQPKQKSFWSALSQFWRNPTTPEARTAVATGGTVREQEDTEGGTKFFLQDASAIVGRGRTAVIKAGEFFGEIAALGRTPRTSTVVADVDSELLEIRWQGLREIRRYSSEIKTHIDRLYRERSLKTHLRETPIFHHLSEADLEKVAAATEFQTHGTFEWYGSYKKLSEMHPAERLQVEPIVAQQGHYPNGVFLVRSGFARLSESYNHGERTISYLGRGQMFGFEEIAGNWRNRTATPYQQTLRAIGYMDVLFVPTAVLEEIVLPTLSESELPVAAASAKSPPPAASRAPAAKLSADVTEFLVEHRFMNGTAPMIINMDRCTRCDDCVRACASTHQNNPRFLRNGLVHGHFMIANACMHCLDPVCMIGCPTGAIHRHAAGGQVVINDLTCIGCSTCANSCPYDNIRMVHVRDTSGDLLYDENSRQPIQKATKCDLCFEQITGPACARACPHEALVRVDMRNLDKLSDWFAQ